MPLSVLSAWTGPGSAKFVSGGADAKGVAGASVSVAADPSDGCLNLTFAPPAEDAARWDVTAAIHFARAP
jgi:hypothetical protein